jgi:hypothetical protein
MDLLDEVGAHLRVLGLVGDQPAPDRWVAKVEGSGQLQVWVSRLPGPQAVNGNGARSAAYTLLSVQVRSGLRVLRPAWPKAIVDLNDWNRRYRLTCAWLAVDQRLSAPDAGVVIEACLPVTADHTAENIDGFVDAVIDDAKRFWQGWAAVG